MIITGLRFMGKRQIGELQPTELVITILISETASIPLEDSDSTLLSAIVPVTVLICLEVIISGINMKNMNFRKLFTGSPIIVINNGVIDQKALKSTRISTADLLDNLRLEGTFDIEKVKYAIVETNGQLSVMLKSSQNPPSAADLGVKTEDEELKYTVINDGAIIGSHLGAIGVTEKEIETQLKKSGLNKNEVMLMTADKNKKYHIVKREKTI